MNTHGCEKQLSNRLNKFQREIQEHLVDWKWEHITKEPGKIVKNGIVYLNDALLPESMVDEYPVLYPDIKKSFLDHNKRFPFKIHDLTNHMASSQIANANLFLPVLYHPAVNEIFSKLRPDFASLAAKELDHGYRIEFWDEPHGNLGDKNKRSGTDSDIAIAYYNHDGQLCLWLIEHKLTENEFSVCNATKYSKDSDQYDCTGSISDILANKNACYYHDKCQFEYWNIMESNRDFFVNQEEFDGCPFDGGMNQLWRNQLLAMSVEAEKEDPYGPYVYVSFSVVKHSGNHYLDKSLSEYERLIGGNEKFSVFTSADVINAAKAVGDDKLNQWISWYCNLYKLTP